MPGENAREINTNTIHMQVKSDDAKLTIMLIRFVYLF